MMVNQNSKKTQISIFKSLDPIFRFCTYCFIIFLSFSCNTPEKKGKIAIGFLDAFEDATIAQAKQGFFVALKDSGFNPETNIEVIYRNAQGDIPVLAQSVDYFISQNVALIVSNTTLSTITAVQKTSSIPVCMIVSPSPELAGLRTKDGKDPINLFGVYETLEYIDTALYLVKTMFPNAKRIGTLINQSEPQSRDALERIQKQAKAMGCEVISVPANNSAETQLAAESLINKGIDVFFALPDNTIFSSFETIVKSCDAAKIPILTSEAGLVSRGALAAFGADIYAWGYESGLEAVYYLKTHKTRAPKKLLKRQRVYNPVKAKMFNITPDSTFQILQ
jgi:putative ABC transport system substrate-binding protein